MNEYSNVRINMQRVSYVSYHSANNSYVFVMDNGHSIEFVPTTDTGERVLKGAEYKVGSDYVLLCESTVIDIEV